MVTKMKMKMKMKEHNNHRYVISVLVADRAGVLYDITSAITDMGADIDGISQTVLDGYFTVILTATFPGPVEMAAVKRTITLNFEADEANIAIRPYGRKPPPEPVPNGECYVLTLTGTDSPGILKTTTGFLAELSINIEDWYVIFQGDHVTHVGVIRVPRHLDLQRLPAQVEKALSRFQLRAACQHENIFRATNEVGPIRNLLTESEHA